MQTQTELFQTRRLAKCQPERLQKGQFSGEAMGFLIKWVKKQGKRPFSAEEITLDAIKAGVAPPDLRYWGGVFQRAAKEGYIRRSRVAFARSMGNNSLTLGWEAV